MGANAELLAYFKELAEKHKSIAHTDNAPRFFRTEIDEFLTTFNKAAKGTCLLLESSDYSLSDNNSDNVIKYRVIAFMIVEHSDRIDDFNRIAEIYDNTEEIADEIVRKIFYDTFERAHSAFQDVDISTVEVNPVMNISDYNYGQRVVISLKKAHDLTPDPTKWEDGYITLNPSYVGND